VILNECDSKDNDKQEQDANAAKNIINNMRKAVLRLKGEYMNDDGSEVDYIGMSTSEAFSDFVKLTRKLKHVDISSISAQERKAFMMNLYNCLTVHGLVNGVLGDASSMTSRMKFYASASYIINGQALSLNDIEHGVLRNNCRSPVSLSSPPFSSSDRDKLALCVELDPRIHFALNCGAKGCPPIGVYSADALDSQLDCATRCYLNETIVDTDKNSISISMLFQWYRADFGDTDSDIIAWIENHASKEISERIKQCRAANQETPSIQYLPYDWNLPAKTR